ncbi:hypothetical protein [Altererythrobacter sp. ZODW24]|uniref:hypothetical protein n=1 Tax=Altererythrobacter sp. ZODW24 TaxID=2185142 RepID=UPI000DF7982E|nr:hypothetical protein [Altererythrobacter sp. ZODW24]
MTAIAKNRRSSSASSETEYLAKSARVFTIQSIGVAILLVIASAGSLIDLSREAMMNFNAAVLIGFLLLSSASAYSLIKFDAYNVWAPSTLFLLSSAVFLGFGPLAYNFGNEGTKTYLALRAPAADAWQVNQANTLSLAGQLGIYVGMAFMFGAKSDRFTASVKGTRAIMFSPTVLAAVFTGAGLAFKYLIYFPSIWGLIDLTVPGILTQINALAAIGFGLWAYVAIRSGPTAIAIFLLFWSVDLGLTTLAFSKRWIVLAMVFPLAGYYLARRNIIMTTVFAAIIVAAYVMAQPMVTFARYAGGSDDAALDFSKRAAIVTEYVVDRPEVSQRSIYEGSQRWWTRLDASGRQAFAMQLHDSGEKSHSLDSLPIIFIPRVIWPDKPIIEPPGKKFYFLVTGRMNNNMPISIYGDLYWQFGWLGILFGTPIIGAILALMVKLIMPEMRRENFVYFPAVLIGMQLALIGANGYLINGFVTAVPIFFIYLYIIKQVDRYGGRALGRSAPILAPS